MDIYIIALVVLVLLAALFSAAEIAFTSLSPAKTKMLQSHAGLSYRLVYRLKQQPENLLMTILIGNNLSSITAAALATYWATLLFGHHAIGIVSGALTLVLLIFGEIIPKTLAQKYAQFFAAVMAYPLIILVYSLYPVLWVLRKFIAGLMMVLKAKSPIETISEDELLAWVDIGAKEGVIEEQEQELIENVLEFADTRVDEVMTLKKNIEALSANLTVHDAAKFLVQHSHSRLPVFRDNLNNIIGVVTVHDILKLSYHQKGDLKLGEMNFAPLIVVPCSQLISTLFRSFQQKRQHLAIVINEHGETVGLVTLEDLLEEIVGEIADEKDLELHKIMKISPFRWIVLGDTTIEEVNDTLDIELHFPEHQTISLFVLEHLKVLPEVGQTLVHDGLVIRVKKVVNNKIEQVMIEKNS